MDKDCCLPIFYEYIRLSLIEKEFFVWNTSCQSSRYLMGQHVSTICFVLAGSLWQGELSIVPAWHDHCNLYGRDTTDSGSSGL